MYKSIIKMTLHYDVESLINNSKTSSDAFSGSGSSIYDRNLNHMAIEKICKSWHFGLHHV